THRLRAEQALRAGEERLNLVLRSTNDGWWDMDLPTGAIFASPRWWEMIGYQTHEMPSARKTWERLTHPDDIARVKETFQQAIASGAVTFEVESRRKHKDGRWLPILTRGFITRDHDGAARRVTGTAADLTELKRSEEQLRDALARFESVVNLSPIVAIQGYDRDGTIRQWNHASERLYGYDAATAIGAKVNELLGEDEASGCQSTIRRVWDQAAPSEPTEWELPTASGQKRWVYSCMFPLFDKGVVTMVCCMDIDITDRKRAEAEAERQLDELRRWQAVTVGREERIMELRREVNDLARRLGAPAPYPEQRSGPPAP
ncbi:MAG: PAS domain S-box protein, partial [Armatimonadetes bacterium]|nr:PAS domain S-box protein [Armatimonadota bacterium]